MDEKRKNFLIYLGFGIVIATLVVVLNWNNGYAWIHMLCDGCFVAAVLLLGFGGLKFARNQGVFDMFSYSIKSVFHLHYPFTKMNSPLEEREESFVDYKERKQAQRKSPREILWAGLVYLVLALVLFVIYLPTSGM